MVDWRKLFKLIPLKVQVGPKSTYDVKWTRDDGTLDHVGITDHNIFNITLNLNLKPKAAIITYLHEVLHAISVAHEVNLTENQILKLERAIYYVLKKGNVFRE